MKLLLRRPLALATFFILLCLALGVTARYVRPRLTAPKEPIPVATGYIPPIIENKDIQPADAPSQTPEIVEPETLPPTTSSPEEINLLVPFTSQAPHKKWDLPYKEFCEEASTLMTSLYFKGTAKISPDEADAALLKIKAFEEQRFGYYEDTTAEETAIILTEYFGIKNVRVVHNPTEQAIRTAVSQKKLVLVPALGTALGNPHFRQPGPPYHMIVIKGYTRSGKFITNDPGTQFGADYLYTPEVIMSAMHDWNDGDVINGKKVILVVGQ